MVLSWGMGVAAYIIFSMSGAGERERESLF